MLILLLAYVGGILTILSPCILPVLPFVFARADRPFLTNGLPMLAGMAITFAGVATLAAVGGEAAVAANSIGRWIALAVLAFFALLLIVPSLSAKVMQPLVATGDRLSARDSGGFGSSILLGIATGLLWAPCAGPILGIILTGAAISGTNSTTALLLLAYALGAATSLALALLAGGRLFAAMKRSIGAGERIRQLLGVLILVAVAAIGFGADTKILANLSTTQTFAIENRLAGLLGMEQRQLSTVTDRSKPLPDEGSLPTLNDADLWLNSPPLTNEQLKGKVVLVDFWTYSCINCIRSIPYVRDWAEKYRNSGLVVIGVHAPEFAFERNPANVRKAVADFGITYPVALDNNLIIWRAFNNQYWPAHYLADANGRLRYHHFGEGREDVTEAAIRSLLIEAGATNLPPAGNAVTTGVSLAPDRTADRSPETYLGYARAANFVPSGGLGKGELTFTPSATLALNQWTLGGRYRVEPQRLVSLDPSNRLMFRFRGRDLHLVLGSTSSKAVRVRVLLDGGVPGADHGLDVDAQGEGVIKEQRLYQLVRQKSGTGERLFTIEFLDPGAEAFAFTFG
nr:cytochrome c biogenesis protein DipZ [uncultured Sphingomonas sp.]